VAFSSNSVFAVISFPRIFGNILGEKVSEKDFGKNFLLISVIVLLVSNYLG